MKQKTSYSMMGGPPCGDAFPGEMGGHSTPTLVPQGQQVCVSTGWAGSRTQFVTTE